MKKHQQNTAIGKPFGSVDIVNRGTEYEYTKGTYVFRGGVVTFYSEPTFASFSFVYRSRIYKMSISEIKKPLTHRQLIVHSGKFAREVQKSFEKV